MLNKEKNTSDAINLRLNLKISNRQVRLLWPCNLITDKWQEYTINKRTSIFVMHAIEQFSVYPDTTANTYLNLKMIQ